MNKVLSGLVCGVGGGSEGSGELVRVATWCPMYRASGLACPAPLPILGSPPCRAQAVLKLTLL